MIPLVVLSLKRGKAGRWARLPAWSAFAVRKGRPRGEF